MYQHFLIHFGDLFFLNLCWNYIEQEKINKE